MNRRSTFKLLGLITVPVALMVMSTEKQYPENTIGYHLKNKLPKEHMNFIEKHFFKYLNNYCPNDKKSGYTLRHSLMIAWEDNIHIFNKIGVYLYQMSNHTMYDYPLTDVIIPKI